MTALTPITRPADGGKRVVRIGSLGFSLVKFRLDLMRRMADLGHEVLAVEIRDRRLGALAAAACNGLEPPARLESGPVTSAETAA